MASVRIYSAAFLCLNFIYTNPKCKLIDKNVALCFLLLLWDHNLITMKWLYEKFIYLYAKKARNTFKLWWSLCEWYTISLSSFFSVQRIKNTSMERSTHQNPSKCKKKGSKSSNVFPKRGIYAWTNVADQWKWMSLY